MKKSFLYTGVLAVIALATSCKNDVNFGLYSDEEYKLIQPVLNIDQVPESFTAQLPTHLSRSGLSTVSSDLAQATLGRVLFYDKDLSSDKTVSCASCHKQEIGFADDRSVSLGVEERSGTRNSIALSSVANFSAYYGNDLNGPGGIPFFWDNRAGTAGEQNIGSMTNPLEMNMQDHEIADAVKSKEFYKPLFAKAFPGGEITTANISTAIAAFVNAMGSYHSRFDQGADASLQANNFSFPDYNKDFSNFSPQENRGKTIYINNCASCHSTNFGRPAKLFSNNGLDAQTSDQGVGGISNISAEMGTFKVPTLRNIAITAPYMHDGRFASLQDVVEHYSTGVKSHPNLGYELQMPGGQPKQFNFTSQDKDDLIAFLNTLTDYDFMADARFSNPFK